MMNFRRWCMEWVLMHGLYWAMVRARQGGDRGRVDLGVGLELPEFQGLFHWRNTCLCPVDGQDVSLVVTDSKPIELPHGHKVASGGEIQISEVDDVTWAVVGFSVSLIILIGMAASTSKGEGYLGEIKKSMKGISKSSSQLGCKMESPFMTANTDIGHGGLDDQDWEMRMLPFTKSQETGGRRYELQNAGTVVVSNELLGCNVYESVWKGIYTCPDELMAANDVVVKEIDLLWPLERGSLDHAREGARIQMRCCHMSIIKCYGFVDKKICGGDNFLTVMERMDKNLCNLIYEDPAFERRCTYRELLNIFIDISSGLRYLHEVQQVVHFDLKPQNVIISSGGRAQLAGFELAMECSEGEIALETNRGTCHYMAPEVCLLAGFVSKKEHKVNASVDVYSFGVLILECILRIKPEDATGENLASDDVPGIGLSSVCTLEGMQRDYLKPLRLLIERCTNFDLDLFLSRGSGDAAEGYQRPSIIEIELRLKEMLKEAWVDEIPGGWEAKPV